MPYASLSTFVVLFLPNLQEDLSREVHANENNLEFLNAFFTSLLRISMFGDFGSRSVAKNYVQKPQILYDHC
jgi:hypothetical protein